MEIELAPLSGSTRSEEPYEEEEEKSLMMGEDSDSGTSDHGFAYKIKREKKRTLVRRFFCCDPVSDDSDDEEEKTPTERSIQRPYGLFGYKSFEEVV